MSFCFHLCSYSSQARRRRLSRQSFGRGVPVLIPPFIGWWLSDFRYLCGDLVERVQKDEKQPIENRRRRTITLHCPHCQSEALVRNGFAQSVQTAVSLQYVQTSKPREPDSPCLSASSQRGDSACLSRTQQSAWSHPRVWDLSLHYV